MYQITTFLFGSITFLALFLLLVVSINIVMKNNKPPKKLISDEGSWRIIPYYRRATYLLNGPFTPAHIRHILPENGWMNISQQSYSQNTNHSLQGEGNNNLQYHITIMF